MAETFHLTPRELWDAQRSNVEYLPEPFTREGFIHCTDGEENVVAVGNRYYTEDSREMVCLVIDSNAVNADIHYEDPQRIYPHIYGPLNTDAVCAVRAVERGPGGIFIRLGEPLTE